MTVSRPRCIFTDLDRTLTDEDLVLDPTALERIRDLRHQGIRVVVATGRRFDDPHAARLLRDLDALVAENGAVVCTPEENRVVVSHPEFADDARAALPELVGHFHWGRVVGSGPRALAQRASDVLARAGIDHAVEFNAEEAMLLPPGVDKATGAAACLRAWGLDAADAWAIGDGENDVAMLEWAGMGAAPGNAVPAAAAAADVRFVAKYARAFLDLTDPLVAVPASAR